MNAPLGHAVEVIAPELLVEARAAAAAGRRRVVDVLEEKLALDPDAFTGRLGSTVHVPVMRMEDLRRAAPAFDVLPFNECAQHECALVHGENGGLLLAFDDPFSAALAAWAEERLTAPFAWRLVHRGDLVAFLASHEETLRALDAVHAGVAAHGEERGRVEDLSLKAISEEPSEVVRLVRSTLHDALKIGASDIHLETVACGSHHQVPHRRDPVPDQEHSGRAAGRTGHLARKGACRTGYRRAAGAAGRTIQGARSRPRGGFPRFDHAEHPRRGCGAARARQAAALRKHPAATVSRQPGIRRRRTSPCCGACRTSPTACCSSPARPAAARPPRSTPRSPRSTTARTRSSRSRTPSNTSFPACCRFR